MKVADWKEPSAARTDRGELHSHEIGVLAELLKVIGARTAFEIGTHRGRTALALAMNMADVGHQVMSKEQVWTLDVEGRPEGLHASDYEYLLERDSVGMVFKDSEYKENIVQLWGDSREFDFTPYHDQFDLVLVDGSHERSIVAKDLENARRMTLDTGIYLCHDFHTWARGCVAAIWEHAEKYQMGIHFDSTILVGFGEILEEMADDGRLYSVST